LEVLITLLVLSLGMLGIAALQIASVRATQGAYLKTQAVNRAYEIVDAMRANRDQAGGGAYDNDFDAGADGYCDIDDPAAAESDLCAWEQALAATLPGGAGSVSVDGNDITTVCIRWAEPRRSVDVGGGNCSTGDGDDGADRQFFELQTIL
jgi:type IV pilus assembly protein PilV